MLRLCKCKACRIYKPLPAGYEFLYLNLQNLFGSKNRCIFVKLFTKLHLGVFSA